MGFRNIIDCLYVVYAIAVLMLSAWIMSFIPLSLYITIPLTLFLWVVLLFVSTVTFVWWLTKDID